MKIHLAEKSLEEKILANRIVSFSTPVTITKDKPDLFVNSMNKFGKDGCDAGLQKILAKVSDNENPT